MTEQAQLCALSVNSHDKTQREAHGHIQRAAIAMRRKVQRIAAYRCRLSTWDQKLTRRTIGATHPHVATKSQGHSVIGTPGALPALDISEFGKVEYPASAPGQLSARCTLWRASRSIGLAKITGASLYPLSQLPSPGTSLYMPAIRPRMTAGAQKPHKFCQRDGIWRVTS